MVSGLDLVVVVVVVVVLALALRMARTSSRDTVAAAVRGFG